MTTASIAVLAACCVLAGAGVVRAAGAAETIPSYQAIERTLSTTVVLNGDKLTVAQLQQVARGGATLQLSGSARQREAENFGLLLEAQAEGVPVYGFNRGGGLGSAVKILEGDPLSADNQALLQRRELEAFEQGALYGDGPEVAEEAVVRATMVIRANQMVHETPSPQLAQMVLDLLNNDITPVMQSRGSVGESDWNLIPNIGAAMVGKGEVYFHGVRMPAAQALHRAGLTLLKPTGADSSTLSNANGYSTALAAFLVERGRRVLEWTDLLHAMDLDGMNGNITPLSAPVQAARPFKWLNWDAKRVLDMLQGSYLFDESPRPLADPDSLRVSAIRQGAAWQAWMTLREDVVTQMNSSDHNPAIETGLSPQDSWELRTPQMMKYYIKGGKYSNGQHGYIVTSANWDPYPMVNDIEAFANALANVGVAVTQRIYRFDNPFFTGVNPHDVLAEAGAAYAPSGSAIVTAHLWQELQMDTTAVPPAGVSSDVQGNGDVQSQAALKADRALQAVDVMRHLLAQDLLTATYWMDLRKHQQPSRSFGKAPEAAWSAFRKNMPWQVVPAADEVPPATLAYRFIRDHRIEEFYSPSASDPAP